MSYVETKIISAALRELADTIECDDGVANMACLQAADRLDELDKLKVSRYIYPCSHDDPRFIVGRTQPLKSVWVTSATHNTKQRIELQEKMGMI